MPIGQYFRKVYEITGYANTEDGYCLCESCYEEWKEDNPGKELQPIFLGDEWDFPGPYCDWCHEHIEANLIKY